ncbi:radical SAM/SPASM domain-containing protein [Virgibacillus pantothenticus]|uniref:radical SAM/SPASM domain-containing protein n=1 Tax=Virgibacillus pantothenticus TaxID=1473 RepID=UPI000984F8BC|nr:radical SAM protein [Virgibacillus pantothenticus]
MLNYYPYKDSVIIHNSNNNSWICIEPNEVEIIENAYKSKQPDYLPKHLKQLITIYKIFDDTVPNIEEMFINQVNSRKIPKTVYIVTTEKCNLQCTYCYAEASPLNNIANELNLLEYNDIFNELKELNVEKIVFTGGEVGIKKDFYKILDLAFKLGFECNLITNGLVAQNKEKAAFLASRCNKITVSIDSLTEENNDLNRGKGCFKVIDKAINNLIDLGFQNIAINQTVTKNNLQDIDMMVDFAEKHGIELNIGPYCEMGRGKENNASLSIDQRIAVEKYSIKMKNRMVPFNVYTHCGQGVSEFSINPIGNVYTCKLLDQPDFLLGNVRVNSLKNIFGNKRIDQKKYSVFSLPKCKSCSFKFLCGGDCRATHYHANDGHSDTNIDDGECVVIKQAIKEHMYQYFHEEIKSC